MKKTASYILAFHFFFAAITLPLSNFDLIAQLPQMYKHCKATEDKDMNFFDFITDHLINVDCIFDKHDNGDHQKPHTPFNFNIQNITLLFFQNSFPVISLYFFPEEIKTFFACDLYKSPYHNSLFHPPAFNI